MSVTTIGWWEWPGSNRHMLADGEAEAGLLMVYNLYGRRFDPVMKKMLCLRLLPPSMSLHYLFVLHSHVLRSVSTPAAQGDHVHSMPYPQYPQPIIK